MQFSPCLASSSTVAPMLYSDFDSVSLTLEVNLACWAGILRTYLALASPIPMDKQGPIQDLNFFKECHTCEMHKS